MKRVYLIIRGICGNPDDCQEWEQHAVDWIHQDPYCRERGFVARCDSYRCSPLTVWLNEEERVASFAEVLDGYVTNGFKVYILCHSNGSRIAIGGMKRAGWPRVEEAHFVCAACDSDFRRNGLNEALRRGTRNAERGIGSVFYYTAGRDWAMRVENTLLGKLDFALPHQSCPLGLRGPRYLDIDLLPRVRPGATTRWEQFGHSTCWSPSYFNNTMLQVTRAAMVHREEMEYCARLSGGAV